MQQHCLTSNLAKCSCSSDARQFPATNNETGFHSANELEAPVELPNPTTSAVSNESTNDVLVSVKFEV